MIAVALKGLLGRKVRALLTAFAVVIGVTMISGTLVITDTIQKAFDGIFGASYAQTDAVIAGKEIVKGSQSGAATVPESLLAEVRGLPEVEAAGGTIAPNASNTAKIFGSDGKPVGVEGAPQFGLGNDVSLPQFSPLRLKSGQWPEGPEQVAVDADTAAGENLRVGDTVTVSTRGTKHRYEMPPGRHSRRHQLARRRHDRGLGPAHRPDAARQARAVRHDRDHCQRRHLAGGAHCTPSSHGSPPAWRSKTPSSRPRRTPRRPTSSSTPSATSCWASERSRCSSARL